MSDAQAVMDTQFLTFTLDEELFAVNIGKVREVIEFDGVTKVPRMPSYMRGVINLRGSVVPVLDLKDKFGMGKTEKAINTCVVITEICVGSESVVLGALADSVQEVFDLDSGQIEPPPRIGTRINTDYISGMGKKGEDFVVILDIDRVFNNAEFSDIADPVAA